MHRILIAMERAYMKRNVYEVRREPGRIVAAEIGDDTAAVLFSEGRSILLATEQELIQLGRQERRVITILGQGTTSHAPGPHATVVVLQQPQAARVSGVARSMPGRSCIAALAAR